MVIFPFLCLKQSSRGLALAMEKAVKSEERWTDAYCVPGLLLGSRATDVILSIRTSRSLCWCLTLTNRGSKALAPKPSWVWNSGDAAGRGPLRPADRPSRLSPRHTRAWGWRLWEKETHLSSGSDNCGVVTKQGSVKNDRGGLPSRVYCKGVLAGNRNLRNTPLGDFAGVLN